MDANTAPQFPVVSQWSLVSRHKDDDGQYTQLRVEKYVDGTGNVFRLLESGEWYQWFIEGIPFEQTAGEYVNDDVNYVVTRVL